MGADTISLATLEEVLLRDARLMVSLKSAGMHVIDSRRVLALRAHDTAASAALRVDLRSPSCFWLNDLELDSAYRWLLTFFRNTKLVNVG
jgi:hypothetical protein